MESLTLTGKNHTPTVILDPEKALFTFQGESFPENPFAYYRPVLEWLDRYFQAVPGSTDTVFEVKLSYLNTSSTKIFVMILDLCAEAVSRGKSVRFVWKYPPGDDLVREMGEDLGWMQTVPFFLVEES